ncbi:endonuclease [Pyxidicoccus fallax]|uniref:Endonuclease n=2 Tax=Pyxidicoccus fallax TaxID=394095 RepID=A0A848L4T1_9BACT|nr:endonuclease [Pyxidicoccus fallax]NPC82708.1 endonuclease [Pyxidicoccus fallax]
MRLREASPREAARAASGRTHEVAAREDAPAVANGTRPGGASVGTSADFTPLPSWSFDASTSAWVQSQADAPLPPPERLTVLTFNVLFDVYDAEQRLATERRVPAMLALLRDTGADVIALQEVTPPFLQALLAEPWVRERYWLSEGPGAATVTPYGQVLLSRLPFSALSQRVFSRDKRIIAARFDLEDAPLWVATHHLTSNHAPTGVGVRARQVQALVEWARSLGTGEAESASDVVLAGDFNFGDAEPENQVFTEAGFVDAWPALRPSEGGETYDPVLNAMAALTTRSGRRQRLDRVMVSSPSGRLVPESVELLGEAPLEGQRAPDGRALHLSDHFGVRCVLHRTRSHRPRPPSTKLVHHTAVVLIPPDSVWEPIQALRRKHDSKFQRWMPHITLLYPFLPEEHFDDAEALLTEALRDVQPFEVSLSEFSHFEHRTNVTAWLRPEDCPRGALQALHAALEKALPECDEQGRKSARGFTPHLSIGQIPRSGAADIERTLAAWARHWRPLTFEVREVCIIRRKGDTPFEVVRRVPLGTPKRAPIPDSPSPQKEEKDPDLRSVLSAHGVDMTPTARHAREEAVRRLQALCTRVGAELHPYGSYLLGTDGPGSDVDAVAIGPSHLSREAFAQALIQELSAASATGRFVADAAIPLVKLSLGGVSFDVAYASRPEGVEPCAPEELLALHSEALDTAGLRSVLGLADIHGLLDAVTRADAGLERFRTLLRTVKAWAKARGIYSHALGYVGGLSWAVMAAWACTRAPREKTVSDVSLLAHFFETFAAWPWPQPVALTPETARYRPDGKRDLFPVIAPAAPARNTARNVSRSTFRVMRGEFARGRDVVRQARQSGTAEAWQSLFTPVDEAHAFQARLELTISALRDDEREAAAGWVLGHLTTLVYPLEGDRRVFVRPVLAPAGKGPLVILGLDAESSVDAWRLFQSADGPLARAVEAFELSFQKWSDRPRTAGLQVKLLHS